MFRKKTINQLTDRNQKLVCDKIEKLRRACANFRGYGIPYEYIKDS